MLTQQQRLRLHPTEKFSGQRIRSAFFDLIYLSVKESSQFAFLVTKKQLKRAVDRNRAKRRVKAAVCESLEHITNKAQVLFIVKKPTLTAPYSDLKQAVVNSLKLIQ